MKTEKILMVCLGNICRSPMAEGILKHLCEKHQKNIEVDSAGTAGYHIGEKADSRAIECLMKKGIDIRSHRARKISYDDLETFDHIYAMDTSNYYNILQLVRNEKQRVKVSLIMNVLYPGQNISVPDPYYGNEKDFENVYNLLIQACEKICLEL